MKKVVCPYCSTEMQLRDCKVVSVVSGNILADPKKSRPLFTTSIIGRKGVRELASRQCVNPQCNKLLPRNIEFVDQNITIAIIGDTFSGKTHYIAALIEQLRSGRYLPPGYNLCLLNPASEEVAEIYERDYYQPMFQRSEILQRSNKVFDEKAEPLIYELTLEGQIRKQVNLLIYDISGEDLLNQRDFMSFRHHLLNAKGILFMADPWAIAGFRNKLAHHLQPDPGQVTGRVVINVLHALAQLYQNNTGRSGRARLNIPVALVITKADLIPYLTINPYFHDLYNPNFEHMMDIDNDSPVNDVIHNLLQELDEPGLVRMVHRLEHARFFVTSATGSNGDMNTGAYPLIKPYRCLDPLFWLLRELRVFI